MAPKDKKIVSTSGIFKKHKDHKHNRKTTWKPTGSKKDSKVPQHPLAQDYTDNIERSRICVLEHANASLESSHHTLTDRLAAITNKSFERIEKAKSLKEELTRSLSSEKLQFEDSSGKPAGVATLGNRMKRFKSLLLAEEGELTRLWNEWTDTQQAIVDLVSHVVEQEKTDQIEAEKLKFAEEIDKICTEAVTRMVASEKEMDIRSRKQQKHFLLALDMD